MDIPQHHLEARRPAPISFDAARAEATSQGIADAPHAIAPAVSGGDSHAVNFAHSTKDEQNLGLGPQNGGIRTYSRPGDGIVEGVTGDEAHE